MPGTETPNSSPDETPFRPDLGREPLTIGAEAAIEKLGEAHVVKTLADVRPEALSEQRRFYNEARSYLPDRLARSLFVRGKTAEGKPGNLVVQELVKGPTLREIDLKKETGSDAELRDDLVKLADEVGKALESGKRLPDLNNKNLIVREAGTKPRVMLVDVGSPVDLAALSEQLGDKNLLRDSYRDLNRQFKKKITSGVERADLPQSLLSNAHYLVTRARQVRQELSEWFDGNWSPDEEAGIHGQDEPDFKPVSQVVGKNKTEVQWILRHAESGEAFQKEFMKRYAVQLRDALFPAVVGSDVHDPRLKARLAASLFSEPR